MRRIGAIFVGHEGYQSTILKGLGTARLVGEYPSVCCFIIRGTYNKAGLKKATLNEIHCDMRLYRPR
jgi:hypothetical protein